MTSSIKFHKHEPKYCESLLFTSGTSLLIFLFNKNDSEIITGRMIQYNGNVADYAVGAIRHKKKVKPNDL